MESVKLSSMAPKKSKFARTVSKVLHRRTASGFAPDEGVQKVKSQEKFNYDKIGGNRAVSRPQIQSFSINKTDDKCQENDNLGVEALVAKLFASVSSAKAAYAQLQCAQSPYDVDGIQAADQLVVEELKKLSELKRRFFKKDFDSSPGTALLLAEVEEQKSVVKTYEIMGKKLESQLRLKDSEIMYLKEKLEESKRQNQSLEKRLNRSGQLNVLDNKLHRSGLSPSHFVAVVQFTVKSIRSFVKLMINEMKVAGWDLDAAANSIAPDVAYWRADDKCFAFESFVCREMFDAFHIPNFALSNGSLPSEKKNQLFFKRFTELKSVKAKDYLAQHPKSTFAKFCKVKYLQLIHPRMEASFFGDLRIRTLVNAGELPVASTLFTSFAEMAKRVWLVHCLAFSFEPEASIFQVSKGCRYSEVYMESAAEEALVSAAYKDPPVAFTVVPGFRIGKTIIQCQVYLCQTQTD